MREWMMYYGLAIRVAIRIIMFAIYSGRAVKIRTNFMVKPAGTPLESYAGISDRIKTGDIVLFSGKGIASWLIKLMTKSEWSHVGVVIRNKKEDEALLLESTTMSNVPDVRTGELTSGVQLTNLRERISKYKGYAAVVRLDADMKWEEYCEVFNGYKDAIRGIPYEKSFVSLFKSAYDGAFGGNTGIHNDSLFCSELVASVTQEAGTLEKALPPGEFTPEDFDPRTNNYYTSNTKVYNLEYLEG